MSEAVEKRDLLYNVSLNLARALEFLCKETTGCIRWICRGGCVFLWMAKSESFRTGSCFHMMKIEASHRRWRETWNWESSGSRILNSRLWGSSFTGRLAYRVEGGIRLCVSWYGVSLLHISRSEFSRCTRKLLCAKTCQHSSLHRGVLEEGGNL